MRENRDYRLTERANSKNYEESNMLRSNCANSSIRADRSDLKRPQACCSSRGNPLELFIESKNSWKNSKHMDVFVALTHPFECVCKFTLTSGDKIPCQSSLWLIQCVWVSDFMTRASSLCSLFKALSNGISLSSYQWGIVLSADLRPNAHLIARFPEGDLTLSLFQFDQRLHWLNTFPLIKLCEPKRKRDKLTVYNDNEKLTSELWTI